MGRIRNLVLTAMVVVGIVAKSSPLDAQVTSTPSQAPSIAVSLRIEKDQISVGQKPRALLTIKNLGQKIYCHSTGFSYYRIRVEGKDGEAPKTEFYRHLIGDFRPGDKPALMEGPVVCVFIAPGESQVMTYDLSYFYDLTALGAYTIYMDVDDQSVPQDVNAMWLRTNTARFEVEARKP